MPSRTDSAQGLDGFGADTVGIEEWEASRMEQFGFSADTCKIRKTTQVPASLQNNLGDPVARSAAPTFPPSP